MNRGECLWNPAPAAKIAARFAPRFRLCVSNSCCCAITEPAWETAFLCPLLYGGSHCPSAEHTVQAADGCSGTVRAIASASWSAGQDSRSNLQAVGADSYVLNGWANPDHSPKERDPVSRYAACPSCHNSCIALVIGKFGPSSLLHFRHSYSPYQVAAISCPAPLGHMLSKRGEPPFRLHRPWHLAPRPSMARPHHPFGPGWP